MTKKRILIVEDDAALARVLRDNLTFDGFEVQCVTDGNAALHTVRTFTPDLVVLDLMLPGMSGFELCGLLRRRGPHADHHPVGARPEGRQAARAESRRRRLHQQAVRSRGVPGARPRRPAPRPAGGRARWRSAAYRRFPRPAARARAAGRSTSRIANSSCSPIWPSARSASSAAPSCCARSGAIRTRRARDRSTTPSRGCARRSSPTPTTRASSTPSTATATASRPLARPSRFPTRSAEIRRPRLPAPGCNHRACDILRQSPT